MAAAYQLLPDLAPDDYARLRDDIAERGVMVPIEVDENGDVLDGHHRKRIADELGIDCPSQTRTGLAEHEKRLHAVSLNLARRHLTDAQKVLLGREIEPDVAEQARRRMAEGGAKSAPGRGKGGTTDPGFPDRTRDEVARKVGIGSGRTYERGKRVVERVEVHDPALVARMAAGEATLHDAERELRQHEQVQPSPAVAEYLDGAQDVQDAHYVRNFTKDLAASGKFLLFDPERLAFLLDDDTAEILTSYPGQVERFLAKFTRARRKLRVVKGAQ